ncbi:MAG TPA: sigma-70 family RNA polymerase sigma factor [Williamwhitmania sp.]|nr:sigma-70 family RNA polymerase sigma factor [Williamwhitmania sp.]
MTDADLIAQIKCGNTNAFRFLVSKYQRLVWHMVLRMVRQQEDAEDMCQEVFIRVFRNIDSYRGDSKLSTWIGSIAYNTCIDHIRRRGKEKLQLNENLEDFSISLPSPQTPSELLQSSDLKRSVHLLVDQLPVHYRTVITLFYLEEFSIQEIGDITSMQEGTIKSYLNRGRKLIRDALVKQFPDIAEERILNNDKQLSL